MLSHEDSSLPLETEFGNMPRKIHVLSETTAELPG